MITVHKTFLKDSRQMTNLPDESIDFVVTSPPYPMIEMWDQVFSTQNAKIGEYLETNNGPVAYELMHRELDKVWDELYRVLKNGAIACINIGDATRTINGRFVLYTNHARIHTYMQKIGFCALPSILWRKQTNAPTKFMGSGMMPPGAYVTLEHEYVLVLRKGNKKEFKTIEQKKLRRESAFFWEERNVWFSDVWMDLKGVSQNLFDSKTRGRSGAFPFELPYRLITMFSVKGDTILDPFLGVGTTMYAAMAAGRNSMGYEIDPVLHEFIDSKCNDILSFANQRISARLQKHIDFVEQRGLKKGNLKYINKHYQFPVVTSQETELIINELKSVKKPEKGVIFVEYFVGPQEDFVIS